MLLELVDDKSNIIVSPNRRAKCDVSELLDPDSSGLKSPSKSATCYILSYKISEFYRIDSRRRL